MISSLRLARKLAQRRFDPVQMLNWMELRSALRDCSSVLDVGCGPASNLQLLECPRLVGIEGYAPSCETARRNATHHEVVLGDIRHLNRLFRPAQFDACVALDVIEHLHKDEGLQLARDMESIASQVVVFLTPSGFLPQHHTEQDDLQEHLSGWDPAEMRSLGYEVIGLLGPKKLRGECHVLRYRPRLFWGLVSLLAQLLWTRRRPEAAAAILACKRLDSNRP